ncbi:MAG: hypothetical protein WBD74_06405 [Candidatus Aquilonibacter sp.]
MPQLLTDQIFPFLVLNGWLPGSTMPAIARKIAFATPAGGVAACTSTQTSTVVPVFVE